MAQAGLKRIAKLYRMVENLHALEVRSALGAVDEVSGVASQMRQSRHLQETHGRERLAAGSRVESLAVERTAAADEVRTMLLNNMKHERMAAYEAAGVAHQQSYQSMRQIEAVVERELVKRREEDTRKEQAASDDRFLSRRAWMHVASAAHEE